jgi:hypothetical protein
MRRRSDSQMLSAQELQENTDGSKNAGDQKPGLPGRTQSGLLPQVPNRGNQEENRNIRQNRFSSHTTDSCISAGAPLLYSSAALGREYHLSARILYPSGELGY